MYNLFSDLFVWYGYLTFVTVICSFVNFQVEDDLQHIYDASNQEELIHFYKQYGKDIIDLNSHAQRRQQVTYLLLTFFS